MSGAGATTRVRDGHVINIEGALFALGHAGFIVVDFIRTATAKSPFSMSLAPTRPRRFSA